MAYTFINQNSGQTETGSPNTVTIDATDMTGADTFVVILGFSDVSSNHSVADGVNDYDLVVRQNNTGDGFGAVSIYVAENATASGSMTWTCTSSNSFTGAVVLGFSGGLASPPADQTSGDWDDDTTTIQPGSITPTQNAELVVSGIVHFDDNSLPTISGGYSTVYGALYVDGESFGVAAAYQIQTTATATNPTWTYDASSDYSAAIASFKAADVALGKLIPRTPA